MRGDCSLIETSGSATSAHCRKGFRHSTDRGGKFQFFPRRRRRQGWNSARNFAIWTTRINRACVFAVTVTRDVLTRGKSKLSAPGILQLPRGLMMRARTRRRKLCFMGFATDMGRQRLSRDRRKNRCAPESVDITVTFANANYPIR